MSRTPDASRNRPRSRARLGRVLVVEDDAVLGLALEDALLRAGAASVAICPSLASTLAALEEGETDAVVLDVHLTDRDDGWVLAELIQQLGTRPPRIVFSTATPEDIPAEIAEMGMIFEKPYEPARLAEELARGTSRGLFSRIRSAIP